MCTVEVGEVDEIKEFLTAHYIGPTEAFWQMVEFGMHEELPLVYCLPVHLQDHQPIYFDGNANPEEVLQRPCSKKTPLTEWFAANRLYPEAKNHTYQDFP
jgi:hypothetical protein